MANCYLVSLIVISILVLIPSSSSSANNIVVVDDTIIDAFIQCLGKQSRPLSYPISDVIYKPTNSSFQELLDNRIYNLRYQQSTTRKPLLIVAPKSELNVPAVVTCARANGLKIKTRSGGHDFEGISYTAPFPFILLDLVNLNNVEIDINDETAWC